MAEENASTPFEGMPTSDDGEFIIFQQAKVPLRNRDDHTIIHDTSTVDYVLKTMEFKKQKKFKLTDFQFCLSANVKEDNLDPESLEIHRDEAETRQTRIENDEMKGKKINAPANEKEAKHDEANLKEEIKKPNSTNLEKPLMEDCLDGIDQSVYKVLEKLRDFYDHENSNDEIRERCYVTVCHKSLDTGIKAGNFNLHKENLADIANLVTTKINNFVNSGSYIRLNVPLNDSFSIRFVVS
jgi:hypothetical protein